MLNKSPDRRPGISQVLQTKLLGKYVKDIVSYGRKIKFQMDDLKKGSEEVKAEEENKSKGKLTVGPQKAAALGDKSTKVPQTAEGSKGLGLAQGRKKGDQSQQKNQEEENKESQEESKKQTVSNDLIPSTEDQSQS